MGQAIRRDRAGDEPTLIDVWSRFNVCLEAFERLATMPSFYHSTAEARARLSAIGETIGGIAEDLSPLALD